MLTHTKSKEEVKNTQQLQQVQQANQYDSQLRYGQTTQEHQQTPLQFWTDDVVLEETIPKKNENLSAEMRSAYKKRHGESMGLKQRVSRTEKTTKRKREYTNSIKNGQARYEHNRSVIEQKYDWQQVLVCEVTENRQENEERLAYAEHVKSALKASLDYSNTEEGNAFNARVVSGFQGTTDEQCAAVLEILGEMKQWDMEVFKNLTDEKISKNYQTLIDRVNKAEAASILMDHIINNGASLDEDFLREIRLRCEYLSQLGPIIQEKKCLMENPYYYLLRKADMDSMTDYQLRAALGNETIQDARLVDYYNAVLSLRQMKAVRERLNDPDTFFSENEYQAGIWAYDSVKDALFNQKERIEQGRTTRQNDINNLAEQKERAWELEVNRKASPFEYEDEEIDIESSEDYFTEFDNENLQQYESMTPKQLLSQYAKIMSLSRTAESLPRYLEYYLINECEMEEEKKNRLIAKCGYIKVLTNYVKSWENVIEDPHYEQIGTEYLLSPKEKLVELIKRTDDPELRLYYQKLNVLKNDRVEQEIHHYNDTIQMYMSLDTSMVFTDYQKVYERYYAHDVTDRVLELLSRRQLFIDAATARCESNRKRERARMVAGKIRGFSKLRRSLQAQILIPGMSDEQIQTRVENLASEDAQERYAEYNRIFDQLLNMDLTPYEGLDTDEKLIENSDMIMHSGEVFIEIGNLLKVALADKMPIPIERQKEIWKRYCFLMALANILKGRLDAIAMEGFAEFTDEEEPKTAEEAMQLANEHMEDKKLIAWLNYMMATLMERDNATIDLNRSLNEQYAGYQPPEMVSGRY